MPSHPLLKQMVSAIVFWRRSADNNDIQTFLPNNICGFGFTLSGELLVKNERDFEKMPPFGTRNIFERSSEVTTSGDFLNISVRCIIPNGLCIFTKMPMNIVYENHSFSLDDIFQNKEMNDIREQLLNAGNDVSRLEILEAFLLKRIINSHPPILAGIIKFIHDSRGLFNVAHIARHFSTTERTVQRYFNKYIGISPNAYVNLIRFRAVLGMSTDSDNDMLGKALEAGYYDQSHFIKHFKEFARVTPGRYFSEHHKDDVSDFYNL